MILADVTLVNGQRFDIMMESETKDEAERELNFYRTGTEIEGEPDFISSVPARPIGAKEFNWRIDPRHIVSWMFIEDTR